MNALIKKDVPLLSIIVPVWNTPSFLLQQSLEPFLNNIDSRIELIIVDDGSSLKTAAYLDSLNFSISSKILHQENLGQNAARQTGVDVARGKYVGFLDSDDCINWKLMLDVLSVAEQEDAEIIAFNGVLVDAEGNDLEISVGNGGVRTDRREYVRTCAELWLQFIRKDFLLKQGGLFVPFGVCIGEDLACMLPMVIRADSIRQVNKVVYRYRQQNTSVNHSSTPTQRMSVLKAFNHIITTLTSKELDEYHDEIEWQAINHLLNYETCAQLRYGFTGLSNVYELCAWMDKYFPEWKKILSQRKNTINKIYLSN